MFLRSRLRPIATPVCDPGQVTRPQAVDHEARHPVTMRSGPSDVPAGITDRGTGWQRRTVQTSEIAGFQETISGGSAGEPPPADPGRRGSGYGWRRERVTPKAAGFKSKNWVRMIIALAFVLCFAFVLYLGYLATGSRHWQNSSEWFQAALPATVSLLGSALGFYYGDKRQDR